MLSCCFLDQSRNIIDSKNENINFNPASNWQIITMYALYHLLGRTINYIFIWRLEKI